MLAIAERAAKWVIANRALPDGGFRHGEKDRGGPFLGDTLAMGQAFLDLYVATGNRDWLTSAAKAGDFVATFRDEAGGFLTSKTSEGKTGVFAKPAKLIDDQVQVARFMNLLNRYYGNEAYREQASHAMRYLASASAEMMRPLPGVLLADEELAVEPTHMTIVGHKDDAPRAVLARLRARAAGPIQAAGMAGPARGQAAQPRCRISRSRRARGIRLQQPHLLVSLLQCRGASGHGEADGEAEAFAGVVELESHCATQRKLCRTDRLIRLKLPRFLDARHAAPDSRAQRNTLGSAGVRHGRAVQAKKRKFSFETL